MGPLTFTHLLPVVLLAACGSSMVAASAPDVVDALPADANAIDLDLGNKVRLVGYRFDAVAAPGSTMQITFFWRREAPLDESWLVYTHIVDDGTGVLNTTCRPGAGCEFTSGPHPSRWEQGKLHVDDQFYTVPLDTKGAELTLYTGVAAPNPPGPWKPQPTLTVVGGPQDGARRVFIGKIRTGLAAGSN